MNFVYSFPVNRTPDNGSPVNGNGVYFVCHRNKQIIFFKEQLVNVQQPVTGMPLGHTVFLSLDASSEVVPLYSSLVSSYKWLDKAHEYSGIAASMLTQNSLGRSSNKVWKGRKKPPITSHQAHPQWVNHFTWLVYIKFSIQIGHRKPNPWKKNLY